MPLFSRADARRFATPHGRVSRKTCTMCGDYKTLDCFNRNGTRWYPSCKSCFGGYQTTRYRLRHPPVRRIKAVRRVAQSTKIREQRHERDFGLTPQGRALMEQQQDGRCAICGRVETHRKRGRVVPLSLDHDHGTGVVRGLLCNNCNRGIGLLGDDSDSLRRAAEYLNRAPEAAAVAPGTPLGA